MSRKLMVCIFMIALVLCGCNDNLHMTTNEEEGTACEHLKEKIFTSQWSNVSNQKYIFFFVSDKNLLSSLKKMVKSLFPILMIRLTTVQKMMP